MNYQEVVEYYGEPDADGILWSIGKYYHEGFWVPLLFCDNCERERIGTVDDIGYHELISFEVLEDIEGLPMIPEGWGFIAREDDQGFVSSEVYETEAEALEAWAGIEEADAEYHQEIQDNAISDIEGEIGTLEKLYLPEGRCTQCRMTYVETVGLRETVHEKGCFVGTKLEALREGIESVKDGDWY